MTSSRRDVPEARLPTPCHDGRKRASASIGTGSTSRRRRASERRRSERITSGSANSRSDSPLRNDPSTRAPDSTRARSRSPTRSGAIPQRPGRSAGHERGMGARPSQQEPVERRLAVPGGRQPRLRHARRRAGADRVAVARHVLDPHPARLAADAQLHDAPVLCQGSERLRRIGQVAAGHDLVGPQVPHPPQQVVDPVEGPHPATANQALQLELEVGDGRRDRAARAAPPRRAARPAARGPGPGPARGARRAARRPRTCRPSTQLKRSPDANGDAVAVSTLTTRIWRARIRLSTSARAGRSKTSRRTSRYVSRMIGNEP